MAIEWRDMIVLIPIFWFILGLGFTLILGDEGLQQSATMSQNNNFNIDSSGFNSSDFEVGGEQTGGADFLDALKVMFGFGFPVGIDFPAIISQILSFVNWLLVIILGISIYRVLNPFSQ